MEKEMGEGHDLTNPTIKPQTEINSDQDTWSPTWTPRTHGCVNTQHLSYREEMVSRQKCFARKREDGEAHGQSLQVLKELPRQCGVGFFLFFSI